MPKTFFHRQREVPSRMKPRDDVTRLADLDVVYRNSREQEILRAGFEIFFDVTEVIHPLQGQHQVTEPRKHPFDGCLSAMTSFECTNGSNDPWKMTADDEPRQTDGLCGAGPLSLGILRQ